MDWIDGLDEKISMCKSDQFKFLRNSSSCETETKETKEKVLHINSDEEQFGDSILYNEYWIRSSTGFTSDIGPRFNLRWPRNYFLRSNLNQ